MACFTKLVSDRLGAYLGTKSCFLLVCQLEMFIRYPGEIAGFSPRLKLKEEVQLIHESHSNPLINNIVYETHEKGQRLKKRRSKVERLLTPTQRHQHAGEYSNEGPGRQRGARKGGVLDTR